MVMMLVGDLHQCLCSVSRADGLPRFNALRIHASIPLCVHHSLEREHVHALKCLSENILNPLNLL